MSEDSTTTVLTFYSKANALLRAAIFIAVLWPLALMTAAILLDPHTAQTVVPLIDLIPIVAVFFLVVGIPFSLAILLHDPIFKKGLLYFVGFLGIELTFGIYLALVPVSSDIGLIPLFITSILALLFLRVAGIALWVRVLLTILLVGITIVFIAGGRNAMKASLRPTVAAPNSGNYQPHAICADAWRHDITPDPDADHFDLVLQEGCFSGFVTLPERFRREYWWQPIDPDPNWWVAFWYEGGSPRGPFSANQRPDFNNVPMRLRLQGRGRIRYYTNEPSLRPNAPSSPGADTSVPNVPQPKPFSSDWTRARQAAVGDFTVVAAPCILAGVNLHCLFRITNESDRTLQVDLNGYAGPIRLIDDDGKEYLTQRVEAGTRKGNQIQTNLPSRTPVLARATFESFTGHSVALLEISIYTWEPINRLHAQIRNLDVVRETP